ncbi:MAG: phenylalanine--tRNA ligase subunit beta [Planctomycetaceae bacterium]|nr:phenylalanine--tRNA ligase subunit beta [Planctomycetaceae bacterium]MCB9949821.1 phenylalanine--tRNA ligase subunit beta [Planctomycetaceae bacterium]
MPIISVEGAWLNRLLGADYPVEELADALEQLGCDVDEVVDIERFRCPNCQFVVEGSLGAESTRRCNWCEFEQEKEFEKIGGSTVIRLDLLAARPDLFDVGGLSRALKGYLETELGLPNYVVGSSDLQVIVDPSTNGDDCQRPYICCAIVEMPDLDEATLISLMKLQETLHWGVGRDRKLASIGVYDLDTVTGPISYTTIDPDNDPFVPLGMPGKSMSGRAILENHPKGVAYAKLLADSKRYPVLQDANGQVLSMPPIINSDTTKVTMKSRRLFIDVTGVSESAVRKSLDTFVASLLELGGTAKSVSIVHPDGTTAVTPDLSPREIRIELAAARRWLGLPLTTETAIRALQKMRLDAEVDTANADTIVVQFPALRTDFKHMVDVFEDLAIGYGYRNIVPSPVGQMTAGQPRPEEQVSELVRGSMIGLGYSEIMSLPMTTEESQFSNFRLPVPECYPRIGNPKLKAMTVVRNHLMTGLMEHLRENRRAPLPLKFFELDNVVNLDGDGEVGTVETRHIAVVEMGREASYASIRSVVDALLFELGVEGTYAAVEYEAFIPGRVAQLSSDGILSGYLGELHPETITNFGLDHPVAIADLTIARVF